MISLKMLILYGVVLSFVPDCNIIKLKCNSRFFSSGALVQTEVE